jgi:hypothetical protein
MAPAEIGHLGWGPAGSATRLALMRSGELSRVSRDLRPRLVTAMWRRIHELMGVVRSTLLVSFGAGASYRPF